MPGRWNKANPPKRPGAYTNFLARAQSRIDAPLSGIVALPVTASWGPTNTVVEINSLGDYVAIFGNDTESSGYRSVYQVFKGQGLEGRGGAAQALIYRMATGAAAEAKRNLANTNGTPDVDAAIVHAKYDGTFGNDLSVTLVANAGDAVNKQDLVVYLNGTEVERHTFTKSNPNTLATAAAGSDYVDIEITNAADPLKVESTPLALTGGNDGAAITGTEVDAALAAYGTKSFAVFVTDLDDDTIQTSIRTWAADPITGHNVKGKRFVTVLGMDDDDLAGALTKADGLDSPDVVLCGGFSVADEQILDDNGDPVVLQPAAFAPRVAGVIAASGDSTSVTFSRFADVSLVTGLASDAEFVSASEGGVLTLAEDSNAVAPVRVEQGVNTYQGDTVDVPNEIFSNIRYVRIMSNIETDITRFCEDNVIGRLTMSQETREYVLGAFQKLMAGYASRGAIQDGFEIYVSQDPPPSDTDDFINLVYEVSLGRDVEQVRGTVVVG